MINFVLINFINNTTKRSFDIVAVGTIEKITAFAEAEAFNYGTDYYLERASTEWDRVFLDALILSNQRLVNLCN